MTNKDLEWMKKLIEEKKQKSAQQGKHGGNQRADRKMGGKGTAIKKYKKGGLFDK
ncbi:MAG: hypothetical protein RO469_03250 [Thermincola sp.]|jgi:hypothetical protein|nr:hypothetical protein [Thermincola sp.]MDT3702399.1 hypothetical protein [Thermincola sp.]